MSTIKLREQYAAVNGHATRDTPREVPQVKENISKCAD